MKNIHLLKTNKPSRLISDGQSLDLLYEINSDVNNWGINRHLYITSEDPIKDGDWCLHFGTSYINKIIGEQTTLVKITDKQLCGKNGGHGYFWKQWDKNAQFSYHHEGLKKIILTTDPDLIKDGVQAIDDEFLEWFIDNTTCDYVEIEDWYNKILSCCRSKEECYCNKKRIIYQ